MISASYRTYHHIVPTPITTQSPFIIFYFKTWLPNNTRNMDLADVFALNCPAPCPSPSLDGLLAALDGTMRLRRLFGKNGRVFVSIPCRAESYNSHTANIRGLLRYGMQRHWCTMPYSSLCHRLLHPDAIACMAFTQNTRLCAGHYDQVVAL